MAARPEPIPHVECPPHRSGRRRGVAARIAVERLLHVLGALLIGLLLCAPAGVADAKTPMPPNVDTIDNPDGSADAFEFGPGDRIYVKVYRHPDLDSEIQIAPDGTMTFPLVGRIQVADRTYDEVVTTLEEGLREYYSDATVSVNVITVANQKVYVVGEVLIPGVLQITGEMNVLEALARSGGINANARTKNLLLIRQDGDSAEMYTLDVDRLLTGDTSQNIQLQAEDILVVPSKTIVNIERFFRHIQSVLGPVVNVSQIYRNLNQQQGTAVIEDGPTTP